MRTVTQAAEAARLRPGGPWPGSASDLPPVTDLSELRKTVALARLPPTGPAQTRTCRRPGSLSESCHPAWASGGLVRVRVPVTLPQLPEGALPVPRPCPAAQGAGPAAAAAAG